MVPQPKPLRHVIKLPRSIDEDPHQPIARCLRCHGREGSAGPMDGDPWIHKRSDRGRQGSP